MVQEIIAGGFIIAHLLASYLAYSLHGSGNRIIYLLILLHLISIPMVFFIWEVVSLISFPLIMVTLIIYIMEEKTAGKIKISK
jgi:uncharacterized membrane protein YhhN